MTQHATHDMHANSLCAFASLDVHGRKAAVLAVYVASPTALTDRDVMRCLGATDPNHVRPRCTELLAEGKLIEVGSIIDPETRRPVRRCINAVLF